MIYLWIAIGVLFVLAIGTLMSMSKMAANLRGRMYLLEDRTSHYEAKFIIPKNEFLYTWSGNPNHGGALEIVEWCSDARVKKGGVRFRYVSDNSDYPDYEEDLTVWIKDPKLAMEFKLKWG